MERSPPSGGNTMLMLQWVRTGSAPVARPLWRGMAWAWESNCSLDVAAGRRLSRQVAGCDWEATYANHTEAQGRPSDKELGTGSLRAARSLDQETPPPRLPLRWSLQRPALGVKQAVAGQSLQSACARLSEPSRAGEGGAGGSANRQLHYQILPQRGPGTVSPWSNVGGCLPQNPFCTPVSAGLGWHQDLPLTELRLLFPLLKGRGGGKGPGHGALWPLCAHGLQDSSGAGGL